MSQKVRRFAYPVAVVAICAALLGLAIHADGAFLTFTDRDAWNAARSGLGLAYNFNDFTVDTPFSAAAYNFGRFTLEQLVTDLDARTGPALIDVAPFDSPDGADGTPYARMFAAPGIGARFNFAMPVTAFGADFIGAGAINFDVSLADRRASITSLGGPTTDSFTFFGFVSNGAPVNRVVLRYDGPGTDSSIVRMDNVAFSSVPEPTSLLLFLTGGAFLGAYATRRSRGQAQEKQSSPPAEG